ncbi:hypothetical protein L1889_16445 [Paenalcaligenes niemegkensis]|uniref:DUF4286 family protein n=1 Tax=Paenalcaligenes niemegkensis TaxID=2895469 RepID=UPI001EE90EAA|nr:DUF4286 family protein [Paenalcaligenes niemegkensis]MCQ9618065.1 hypothetical protein [Paenalcaligenes niemegkensis]
MASPIRQDRAAQGELFIWTDIDPAYEEDFNQWYDREHMEERAAIPGFKWARRYKARQGDRRYLAVYRTETVNVFTSDIYRQAFEQQTPWSITNFGRMRNTNRRVMVVSPLAGAGTGAAVALIALGSVETAERIAQIAERVLDEVDGVLALRVLTPEPELSTPLPSENTEARVLEPFLIIDTTTEPAAAAVSRLIVEELGLNGSSAATFSLLWDLRSADLSA